MARGRNNFGFIAEPKPTPVDKPAVEIIDEKTFNDEINNQIVKEEKQNEKPSEHPKFSKFKQGVK